MIFFWHRRRPFFYSEVLVLYGTNGNFVRKFRSGEGYLPRKGTESLVSELVGETKEGLGGGSRGLHTPHVAEGNATINFCKASRAQLTVQRES